MLLGHDDLFIAIVFWLFLSCNVAERSWLLNALILHSIFLGPLLYCYLLYDPLVACVQSRGNMVANCKFPPDGPDGCAGLVVAGTRWLLVGASKRERNRKRDELGCLRQEWYMKSDDEQSKKKWYDICTYPRFLHLSSLVYHLPGVQSIDQQKQRLFSVIIVLEINTWFVKVKKLLHCFLFSLRK